MQYTELYRWPCSMCCSLTEGNRNSRCPENLSCGLHYRIKGFKFDWTVNTLHLTKIILLFLSEGHSTHLPRYVLSEKTLMRWKLNFWKLITFLVLIHAKKTLVRLPTEVMANCVSSCSVPKSCVQWYRTCFICKTS